MRELVEELRQDASDLNMSLKNVSGFTFIDKDTGSIVASFQTVSEALSWLSERTSNVGHLG
jgi:hypothetical protein